MPRLLASSAAFSPGYCGNDESILHSASLVKGSWSTNPILLTSVPNESRMGLRDKFKRTFGSSGGEGSASTPAAAIAQGLKPAEAHPRDPPKPLDIGILSAGDVPIAEYITCLYTLIAVVADVANSIVFVHGLTGHRDGTWTALGAKEPWPRSLLPGLYIYDCEIDILQHIVDR